MLYYLGKGTEFKKEECKEYKTKDGAFKAIAKTEDGVVWDENGQIVVSMVNAADVPPGALETNPDGSVNTYDENGNPVGTVDAATVAELTGTDGDGQQEEKEQESTGDEPEAGENGSNEDKPENEPPEKENGENGANTASDGGEDGNGQQDTVIVPQGTMKVTVVCDGTLNIRRSPAWGNDNICGRAMRGQSYYVKEIHTVNGKKMVRTIDDLYLSGQSEHVQFEQL